ncbi:MAG: nucleotidyl transferase AbiEii/AbiGii toxin family protein [Bacteroidales bacterium]|nr:nucleotidyl transferase AbiEii/AbiGii toxin family protein [Bacteroidales bacterium]
MQKDYYRNILYPLQNKVLKMMGRLPVDFYLTGGTALSRAYLNHRYSDDLDFFVNGSENFKSQVDTVVKSLPEIRLKPQIIQADEGFVRINIPESQCMLKLDFVNDVIYRSGEPVLTKIYRLTDTPVNILINKITALPRLEAKDVADIVFISIKYSFNWTSVISEAAEKDLWVSPPETAKILDEFPMERLTDINWIDQAPDPQWFGSRLRIIIKDILQGNDNTLYGE